MNREIKFRAWHKNIKEMCQNVTTDLTNRNYLEFMQYTGLKGRKGVEIYEGDIVIPRYNGFKAFVVKYENGKFNVAGFDVDNVEVLGNIFENPNLLEQS